MTLYQVNIFDTLDIVGFLILSWNPQFQTSTCSIAFIGLEFFSLYQRSMDGAEITCFWLDSLGIPFPPQNWYSCLGIAYSDRVDHVLRRLQFINTLS